MVKSFQYLVNYCRKSIILDYLSPRFFYQSSRIVAQGEGFSECLKPFTRVYRFFPSSLAIAASISRSLYTPLFADIRLALRMHIAFRDRSTTVTSEKLSSRLEMVLITRANMIRFRKLRLCAQTSNSGIPAIRVSQLNISRSVGNRERKRAKS